MARDDPHFRLRIPEDLKLKVEDAARLAHHSITAEIVARLRQSFEEGSSLERQYLSQYVGHLEAQNDALKKAQSLLEVLLFDFAHALRKAGAGDLSRLNQLVEQEKERGMLNKIVASTIDLSEG